MELTWIFGGLAGASPQLAMWIVAVVLSSVLLRRSGGSPERFLVIGSSSLMLLSTIVSRSADVIADYANQSGYSNGDAMRTAFWSSLLIGTPGIVCLFYAVWKKFNEEHGSASMRAKSRDISS